MSLTEMCDLLEGDDPKVLLGRLASAMTVIREVIGEPDHVEDKQHHHSE